MKSASRSCVVNVRALLTIYGQVMIMQNELRRLIILLGCMLVVIRPTFAGEVQVLTSITVSPSSAIMDRGAMSTFTATGFDQSGNIMQVQPAFSWGVSPLAGSVSGGQFISDASTPLSQATITVTAAGVTAMIPISFNSIYRWVFTSYGNPRIATNQNAEGYAYWFANNITGVLPTTLNLDTTSFGAFGIGINGSKRRSDERAWVGFTIPDRASSPQVITSASFDFYAADVGPNYDSPGPLTAQRNPPGSSATITLRSMKMKEDSLLSGKGLLPAAIYADCGDGEEMGTVTITKDQSFWGYPSGDKIQVTLNSAAVRSLQKARPAPGQSGFFAIGLSLSAGGQVEIGSRWNTDDGPGGSVVYHIGQDMRLTVHGYDRPEQFGDDPPPDECLVKGGRDSAGQSVVDNALLSHLHEAVDYGMPDDRVGCSSCGGEDAPPSSALPSLRIERLHMYREVDWRGSFGPGVFSGYDAALAIYTTSRVIEYWDPRLRQSRMLTDGGTGIFADTTNQSIKGLRLYDGSSAQTASIASARTAVLTLWGGETRTFQLFTLESSGTENLHGRLTAMTDRNGNAISIAYVDADPQATNLQLGYDRTRLWRMATVTDAYGKSAVLTYARSRGQWVITGIDCPNGTHIAYRYNDSHLVGVNRIDLPDGTRSTFSSSFDPSSFAQRLAIDDAAADGTHRRKTLYLSTALSNKSGLVVNQPSNRVRRVENGDGEVSYANWVEVNGAVRSTFILEGGSGAGVLKRYDAINGRPIGTYRAVQWSPDVPSSAFVWELIAAYETNVEGRVTAATDNVNRRTVYDRDQSGAVLGITRYEADGVTIFARETTTYNQFKQPLIHVKYSGPGDMIGRTTKYDYDTKGNMLSRTVAFGSADQAVWGWTYNARGQVLTATDANTRATNYTYQEIAGDPQYRRMIASLEPPDRVGDAQAVNLFHYDTAGRLASRTDAGSRTATFTYDVRNRPSAVTYGDGSIERWTYGASGSGTANLVIRREDRNRNAEVFTYDQTGRKIMATIAGPGSGVIGQTEWDYVRGRELVAKVVVDGDETSYFYDGQFRLIGTTRKPRSATSLTESTVYGDDQQVFMTTDAYGRRTYRFANHHGMTTREVRELVPGAPGLPSRYVATPYAEAIKMVKALQRSLVPNPAYVITDMTYNGFGELVTRIDGRGIMSTYEYDGQGRLFATVDGSYDTTTLPASVLMNAGRTEFRYDAQGNKTLVRRPRSFARNPDGTFALLAARTETVSTYTGRNLLASVTEASGTVDAATVTYTYTPTRQMATATSRRNAAWLTTYSYHACCDRVKDVIDSVGGVTSYEYDANGNLLSVRDPNGNATRFTYDARNRRLTTTNAENETTSWIYYEAYANSALGLGNGADGSAVEVRNPLGESRWEIRDGTGRIVRAIDGNGGQTTITYTDTIHTQLLQIQQTDPIGRQTSQWIDARGQVRDAYDAQSAHSSATYDANGNQLSLRDPNDVGWTVANDLSGHDGRNRVLKRTDTHGDSQQIAYDLNGNVITVTDARAKATSTAFDARDRKKTVTDRVGGSTTYLYDQENNLIGITDADTAAGITTQGVTSYAYTRRNELESETFPPNVDGKRTVHTYAYDSGRRLTIRTVTSSPVGTPALIEATSYAYDRANRLVRRGYNDQLGDDVFIYDDASRLTSATAQRSGTVVTRRYRDGAERGGRLTNETMVIGGFNPATFSTSFTYDGNNQKATITYPGGDVVQRLNTTRDQLNIVRWNGVAAATRTYDLGGRLSTTTLGNALVETRTYRSDAGGVDNQLAGITVPSVVSFAYQYDANKRKTAESDGVVVSLSQQFNAYDDENRLTSWSRTAGDSQSWTLSKVGDWQSTTINGVPQARTHDSVHETTAVNGVPLTYDLKGNLRSDQAGRTYGWDIENRLTTASAVDAVTGARDTARYVYDALGRRVQKLVHGITTTFVHDGAQVIYEIDAPTRVTGPELADEGDGSGQPPGGGILQGAGTTRVNFQPDVSRVPSGFIADKGRIYGSRTNGRRYGWVGSARTATIARNQHPFPEYDTFNQCWLNNQGAAGTWELSLPNGQYAVVVVMGDCASTLQTNDLTIESFSETDPDPSAPSNGYNRGDFDGYAETVTITDGKLTITPRASALNPKVCFVEIGPLGSSITQADRDRLAAAITAATDATGAPPFPAPRSGPIRYVYGSYVDEPLMMVTGSGGSLAKYYYHANHLYSVAALSSSSGAVVERYKYDAYGKQTPMVPNGTTSYATSAYGQFVGFTGRYHDPETGLGYFRARYYDVGLGRFIGRDPYRYVDGLGLYSAYYIPNQMDPFGLNACPSPKEAFNLAKGVIQIGEGMTGLGLNLRDLSADELGKGFIGAIAGSMLNAATVPEFGYGPKAKLGQLAVDIAKASIESFKDDSGNAGLSALASERLGRVLRELSGRIGALPPDVLDGIAQYELTKNVTEKVKSDVQKIVKEVLENQAANHLLLNPKGWIHNGDPTFTGVVDFEDCEKCTYRADFAWKVRDSVDFESMNGKDAGVTIGSYVRTTYTWSVNKETKAVSDVQRSGGYSPINGNN